MTLCTEQRLGDYSPNCVQIRGHKVPKKRVLSVFCMYLAPLTQRVMWGISITWHSSSFIVNFCTVFCEVFFVVIFYSFQDILDRKRQKSAYFQNLKVIYFSSYFNAVFLWSVYRNGLLMHHWYKFAILFRKGAQIPKFRIFERYIEFYFSSNFDVFFCCWMDCVECFRWYVDGQIFLTILHFYF